MVAGNSQSLPCYPDRWRRLHKDARTQAGYPCYVLSCRGNCRIDVATGADVVVRQDTRARLLGTALMLDYCNLAQCRERHPSGTGWPRAELSRDGRRRSRSTACSPRRALRSRGSGRRVVVGRVRCGSSSLDASANSRVSIDPEFWMTSTCLTISPRSIRSEKFFLRTIDCIGFGGLT